ncbi:hypothetical protein F4804DRAFT_304157 [Jackrogersella minutella]|nr:hypothetical protein F4804DRAFT_304157 [Jackrogersella minutella]
MKISKIFSFGALQVLCMFLWIAHNRRCTFRVSYICMKVGYLHVGERHGTSSITLDACCFLAARRRKVQDVRPAI